MISFEWIDRDGAVHQLDSPAAIDEEVASVSKEIDQLVLRMDHAEPGRKSQLRLAIVSLTARLRKLKSDAERWDAFACEQTRVQAIELAQMVES